MSTRPQGVGKGKGIYRRPKVMECQDPPEEVWLASDVCCGMCGVRALRLRDYSIIDTFRCVACDRVWYCLDDK